MFNNKTFEAEHSIAKIYAVDSSKLAIEAGDVKSKIDFVARRGDFVANNPNELITFPYNLYATSLPVFTWFFDEKRMDFSMPISSTSKYKFVSIHPSQDSLNFEAQKATYDLVQEDIKIDGVPKILVADDSAFMRNVLKNILENNGCKNFIEAADGNEALEKIKTEKPDLVLLDVIMPNVGGIEVIKEIGKQFKVIIISAVGQEKIVKEAESYGAIGYIIKPFDNNQVIEEVNKAIG